MQRLSKLPRTGTSIFSVMSALAQEHRAVNLSQGFPNFDGDSRLRERMEHYLRAGFQYNQYAPMGGVPALTGAIANKIKQLYQSDYDAREEITVTAGATQALAAALLALVSAGDEVLLIEPAYDSYRPLIELVGGLPVVYELTAPDWRIDPERFRALLSPRTRLILLNTPHNPTGSILRRADMQAIADAVAGTDILLLSDEVYEHILFDGEKHESILSFPELRRRALAVFSFGKTFHNTGWKVGYIVGDAPLMAEIRKLHQFLVFSVNTPAQYAIADYLQEPDSYLALPDFFQDKRDRWLELSSGLPWRNLRSEGTYFQIVDFSGISQEPDVDFARRLTIDYGVATIPLSVFYHSGLDQKLLRLCFAKTDETLTQAALRLHALPTALAGK